MNGKALFVVLGLLSAGPRVSVAVHPSVVRVGGDVRVTCRAPRDARNRWLVVGIERYTSSGRQMDGEDSPITYEITFHQVPCGAGAGYCQLVGDDRKVIEVSAPLLVAGCNDE